MGDYFWDKSQMTPFHNKLLFEDKVHRQHQTQEADVVIPLEAFVHKDCHKEREDHKRYYLLNNLKVPEGEGATEVGTTDTVGGNLKAILKECHTPTNEDNSEHTVALQARLKGDMAIPRKGHKDI